MQKLKLMTNNEIKKLKEKLTFLKKGLMRDLLSGRVRTDRLDSIRETIK